MMGWRNGDEEFLVRAKIFINQDVVFYEKQLSSARRRVAEWIYSKISNRSVYITIEEIGFSWDERRYRFSKDETIVPHDLLEFRISVKFVNKMLIHMNIHDVFSYFKFRYYPITYMVVPLFDEDEEIWQSQLRES